MHQFMIKVLAFILCYSTLSPDVAAENANIAAQNAQQKEMQQATRFVERLSTQTTMPLKYSMVGYLESWGTISIEEAVANHYNLIVIAFGTVDEDHIGINLNCGAAMPDGCFLPSVQWWPEPPEWIPNFTNSVAFAHSKGVRVLLSFGGANNTFKPGTISSSALAQSIVDYLERLDLDGIDFDLEYISTIDFPGDLTARQHSMVALSRE